MTKFAFLFGVCAGLLMAGASFAQDREAASQSQASANQPVKAPPVPLTKSAPSTRSLHLAPPAASQAPAPASKKDSSSPDAVVGGLPGAKSAASEQQP